MKWQNKFCNKILLQFLNLFYLISWNTRNALPLGCSTLQFATGRFARLLHCQHVLRHFTSRLLQHMGYTGENKMCHMRAEILTTVSIMITVFQDVALHSLVVRYQGSTYQKIRNLKYTTSHKRGYMVA